MRSVGRHQRLFSHPLPDGAAAGAAADRYPLANGALHALLYKPAGDGPFPTVIALHGCGGLAAHDEPIQPRYRDWAEQWLKAGNAVLLPDSYGSRELGPQCRVNVKERRVLARRERVADVLAARQWLLQQPWVSRDRIALVGWANGASTVLWVVRPQLPSKTDSDCPRWRPIRLPVVERVDGARVPTLLLIGANDNLSSPSACRQMIDGARGRSALARIVVYPGAYHDFDRPDFPLQAVAENSDDGVTEHGHLGTDPEARADSQKRVEEWLAR